jgi:hypothetical protein
MVGTSGSSSNLKLANAWRGEGLAACGLMPAGGAAHGAGLAAGSAIFFASEIINQQNVDQS